MYSAYELTSAKGAVEKCNVIALSYNKFLEYYIRCNGVWT